MKKGFIATIIGICSGTEIFSDLKSAPFYRSIWHLFLLAICCGFINISLQLHPFNQGFEKSCVALSKHFGDIELSNNGLTPTIDKEKSSSVQFDNFRVDFLPSADDLKKYKPNNDHLKGIVWTPESLLVWFKYLDGEDYSILPLLLPTSNLKSSSEMLDLFKKATENSAKPPFFVISKMYKISPSENNSSTITSFRDFKTNLFMWIPLSIPSLFSIYLFLVVFANIMTISLFYLWIFSIFSSYFGKSTLLNLPFAKIFLVSIYISFPGFIIATIYSALRLPYVSFQTIFLITYFIYSIPVFGRLQRENEGKNTV